MGPEAAEDETGLLDFQVEDGNAGPPAGCRAGRLLDSVVRAVVGVLGIVVSSVVGDSGSVVTGVKVGARQDAPHPRVELKLPPLAHQPGLKKLPAVCRLLVVGVVVSSRPSLSWLLPQDHQRGPGDHARVADVGGVIERLQPPRVAKQQPEAALRGRPWRRRSLVVGVVSSSSSLVRKVRALENSEGSTRRVDRDPGGVRVLRTADCSTPRRGEASEDGLQVLVFSVVQAGAPPGCIADVPEAQPRAGGRRSHGVIVDPRHARHGVEEGELQHDGVVVLVLGHDDPLDVKVEEGLG